MSPFVRSFVLLGFLIGVAPASVSAQFRFDNGGGDGRWSNAANWNGAGGGHPDAMGVVAQMASTLGFTTVLDTDATVGALRNSAGSARIWTITNEGGFTLTLDNTSGARNEWGGTAASIRGISSGGIVCAANLRLRRTDLDIGTGGSKHLAAQITLSGAITADDDVTITVRNSQRQTNLLGAIGMDGAGMITLLNLSSAGEGAGETNQLTIAGELGPRVRQLVQGEGVTEGMVVTGANTAFRGAVIVLANTITVGNGATLGDMNTITISNGGRLGVHNAKGLGAGASLEVQRLGKLSLQYLGTTAIDALSLDGGMTFESPGSVWGATGSGALRETRQIEGPGMLQVVPARSGR